MMTLPRLLLITPDPGPLSAWSAFCGHLDQRLSQQPMAVILRAKAMGVEEYCLLATEVAVICRRHQVPLQLAHSCAVDGAIGSHLDSTALQAYIAKAVPLQGLVTGSCHTLEDMQRAEQAGLGALLLSPVQATATHPDAIPLGWERFQQLASQVSIPVFALGGVGPSDLGLARRYGAYGIAAIRGLWEPVANSSSR